MWILGLKFISLYKIVHKINLFLLDCVSVKKKKKDYRLYLPVGEGPSNSPRDQHGLRHTKRLNYLYLRSAVNLQNSTLVVFQYPYKFSPTGSLLLGIPKAYRYGFLEQSSDTVHIWPWPSPCSTTGEWFKLSELWFLHLLKTILFSSLYPIPWHPEWLVFNIQ